MIVLVRHGQTDANRDGLLLGRADVPLNATGREQAAAAAAALASAPSAVHTSPLARARDTAAAIGERWRVEVTVDERLIEVDYGEWDERPLADVPMEAWARWREDADFAPPGGESLASVHERVASWARDTLDASGGGAIVGVSHVSPIKAAVAWALGGGPELSWRLRLDVGSVSRITRGPGGPVLQAWNVVPRPA